MLQSQLVLGVISFLSIGRDCFWRAHKLADGFSVTRFETPSLLVKRFVVLSLYEQNVWKVTHVSRKSTRMWLAIGERGLESLHLLLPFHGLFLSANAGADASASGGRGECVWEQRRSRLGAEADADGAKFADKLGICIYEASGVPAASLICVASSLSGHFSSESRLTGGAETSRSRLTADAAKRLL